MSDSESSNNESCVHNGFRLVIRESGFQVSQCPKCKYTQIKRIVDNKPVLYDIFGRDMVYRDNEPVVLDPELITVKVRVHVPRIPPEYLNDRYKWVPVCKIGCPYLVTATPEDIKSLKEDHRLTVSKGK